MKLTVIRIYEKVSPSQEIGLHSFDLEAAGVSSPAEIDALIKKMTELRVEMVSPMSGEKDMDQG